MKFSHKLKLLISAVLAGTIFLANLASAQLLGVPTIEGPGPLLSGVTAVVGSTATTATAATSIAAGVGNPATQAGVSASIASGLSKLANQVCNAVGDLEIAAKVTDNISNFSFIGGSAAEAGLIEKKIATLVALQACRKAQLTVLTNLPIANLLMGQELQRRQDDLTKEIASLSLRIESLRAQLSASVKDVLKAIAIQLVLTASKKLTTVLVNKLVATYGIANYLKYADAVATQVYDIDYIKTNYPKNQDQLILASILKNQGFQNNVLPLVREQAKDSLGFVPDQLVISDPNYYVHLAQVGSGNSDPYFLQTVFNDKATTVRGQSTSQAQSEIISGKGFIAPRDCQDVTNQQKIIDQQNLTLSAKVGFDQDVLGRLQNSGNAKAADITQAQQQLDASTKALKGLPAALPNVMVAPCKAINNPGAFMGDTIANYLNQHLQSAGNVNSVNIPFWGTFLESVADNLITNVIQGGRSTVGILTGAGIQAANIAANDIAKGVDDTRALKTGTEQAANDLNIQQNGGVLFRFSGSTYNSADFTFTVPQGITNLNWSVDTGQVPAAKAVSITGDIPISGIQMGSVVNQLAGIGQVNFAVPGTYNYTFKVYGNDTQGKPTVVLQNLTMKIQVLIQTIPSSASTTVTLRGGGTVAGAFAARPVAAIRGPRVVLSLRGN